LNSQLSPVWLKHHRKRRRRKTRFLSPDLDFQKAGLQCHFSEAGPPSRPSKSLRPLLLPAPTRARPSPQRSDSVATTATDAPAAKQAARQWNGRGATVQDLRPSHRPSDNALAAHVPNIWHRLFPDRDQAPALRSAVSARAFHLPAESPSALAHRLMAAGLLKGETKPHPNRIHLPRA